MDEPRTMQHFTNEEHLQYCPHSTSKYDRCGKSTCGMMGSECEIKNILRSNHKSNIQLYRDEFIFNREG